MNKYLFIGLFLLIGTVAFSNDSRITYGGSVRVLDDENTNISMAEEEIIITLHRGYYEVEVSFDFYNDGPSEHIVLGFPIRVTSQMTPKDNELAEDIVFESFINGNILTEYTMIEEQVPADEYGWYKYFTRWYIREVTFPENSHTYSKVTYRAPYSYSGFYTYAGYIFGTGRSWKGPIGKMKVVVNQDDDVVIHNVRFGNDRTYGFPWVADGKHEFVLEKIKPLEDEKIEMQIRYIGFYNDSNGRLRYDNAFEDWYTESYWSKNLFEDRPTMLFTKNQMRLFINFFYYYHGYEFKNPMWIYYFDKLYSVTTYGRTINPDFSENDFNEIERANIEYLLNLERIVPPGTNRQSLDEWFGYEGEPVTDDSESLVFLNEDNYLELLDSAYSAQEDINANKTSSNTIFIIALIAVLIAGTAVICILAIKRRKKSA